MRNFCLNFVHGSALGGSVGVGACLLIGFPVTPLAWATADIAIILSCYIMLFDNKRYQDSCLVTKIVRYAVFRPLRFIQFCWWILRWAAYGMKPMSFPADNVIPHLTFSRRETLDHFWTISRSMANEDMQKWSTMEEWLAQLRVK